MRLWKVNVPPRRSDEFCGAEIKMVGLGGIWGCEITMEAH